MDSQITLRPPASLQPLIDGAIKSLTHAMRLAARDGGTTLEQYKRIVTRHWTRHFQAKHGKHPDIRILEFSMPAHNLGVRITIRVRDWDLVFDNANSDFVFSLSSPAQPDLLHVYRILTSGSPDEITQLLTSTPLEEIASWLFGSDRLSVAEYAAFIGSTHIVKVLAQIGYRPSPNERLLFHAFRGDHLPMVAQLGSSFPDHIKSEGLRALSSLILPI